MRYDQGKFVNIFDKIPMKKRSSRAVDLLIDSFQRAIILLNVTNLTRVSNLGL